MAEADEQKIAELEAEVSALKDALAAQQESGQKKYFDMEKDQKRSRRRITEGFGGNQAGHRKV